MVQTKVGAPAGGGGGSTGATFATRCWLFQEAEGGGEGGSQACCWKRGYRVWEAEEGAS